MITLTDVALASAVALVLAVLPGQLDKLRDQIVEQVDCAAALKPGEHRSTLVRQDGKTRIQCKPTTEKGYPHE